MLSRIVLLGFLACALGRAETWTGWLVNAKCYEYEVHNVSPTDSLINVDRDRGEEVLFCSPNGKTKTFTIVDRDGYKFNLDLNGNTQAGDLVRTTGKRDYYPVTVTGEKDNNTKNTIKVLSIAPDQQASK